MVHINKNHRDYKTTTSEAANYQNRFLTAKSRPFVPYHTTLFLSLPSIYRFLPSQLNLTASHSFPPSTNLFHSSNSHTKFQLLIHFYWCVPPSSFTALLFLFPFSFLISLVYPRSFNGTKIQSRKGQGREEEEGRKGYKLLIAMLLIWRPFNIDNAKFDSVEIIKFHGMKLNV